MLLNYSAERKKVPEGRFQIVFLDQWSVLHHFGERAIGNDVSLIHDQGAGTDVQRHVQVVRREDQRAVELGPTRTLISEARKKTEEEKATRMILSGLSFFSTCNKTFLFGSAEGKRFVFWRQAIPFSVRNSR